MPDIIGPGFGYQPLGGEAPDPREAMRRGAAVRAQQQQQLAKLPDEQLLTLDPTWVHQNLDPATRTRFEYLKQQRVSYQRDLNELRQMREQPERYSEEDISRVTRLFATRYADMPGAAEAVAAGEELGLGVKREMTLEERKHELELEKLRQAGRVGLERERIGGRVELAEVKGNIRAQASALDRTHDADQAKLEAGLRDLLAAKADARIPARDKYLAEKREVEAGRGREHDQWMSQFDAENDRIMQLRGHEFRVARMEVSAAIDQAAAVAERDFQRDMVLLEQEWKAGEAERERTFKEHVARLKLESKEKIASERLKFEREGLAERKAQAALRAHQKVMAINLKKLEIERRYDPRRFAAKRASMENAVVNKTLSAFKHPQLGMDWRAVESYAQGLGMPPMEGYEPPRSKTGRLRGPGPHTMSLYQAQAQSFQSAAALPLGFTEDE